MFLFRIVFFVYRHTTSRRDLTSAEVASSVDLYLEKQDAGRSSAVQISLTEPGLIAVRTRLQFRGGTKALVTSTTSTCNSDCSVLLSNLLSICDCRKEE